MPHLRWIAPPGSEPVEVLRVAAHDIHRWLTQSRYPERPGGGRARRHYDLTRQFLELHRWLRRG